MRPGEADELLSAYLDREVTPAEREWIESQLDASPDTRAELDAVAELSLCLRTMDRPEAPPELKSDIMQALVGRRIEAVPAKPAGRRLRREWNVMTIAAIATAACGLYIAVTGLNTGNLAKKSSFAVSVTDSAHPTIRTSLDDLASDRERMMVRNEFGDGLTDTASETFSASFKRHADLAPRGAAENAPTSGPATPGSAVMLRGNAHIDGTAPVAGKPSSSEDNALDKVALNDFLNTWAATDAPDRYVANIDLMVLDVRRTATGFQALLLDNGVENAPENEARQAKLSGSGKKLASDAPAANAELSESLGDESMIAVYVDTTTDRVTRSLEELSLKYDVVGIRLQQPLALAREVEDEVIADPKNEVQMAEKSQRRATTPTDVTNEYFLQQRAYSLEAAEIDGPADAIKAVNTDDYAAALASTNPAAEASNPDSRLSPGTPAPRAAKFLANQKNEALANLKDRNAAVNLNYCAEVRLPFANNFGLVNNSDMNTNGFAPFDAKSNGLALQNTSGTKDFARNSLPNHQVGNSGAANGRYRQSSARDGGSSVRVLVVFQDAPLPAKAKSGP